MAACQVALPDLESETLVLFYTQEPLLNNSPVLIFYGPSATGNTTLNTSRVQAHVYSWAGFQSFPRLTIAPTSPPYVAVHHLPSDLQGDETVRGLAVSILSYFAAISEATKTYLKEFAQSLNPDGVAPVMFDEMHAAQLASDMIQIRKTPELTKSLKAGLAQRERSWADVDVILPAGSITETPWNKGSENSNVVKGPAVLDFGVFNSFIESLGVPTNLSTTKLQREHSKSTISDSRRPLGRDSKIALRREMCELVDTESNYLTKLRDIEQNILPNVRRLSSSEIGRRIVPDSLSKILDVNESFYQEIQSTLDDTEAAAIEDIDIEGWKSQETTAMKSPSLCLEDATGLYQFAQTFVRMFPEFKSPYQSYLELSAELTSAIASFTNAQSMEAREYLSEIGEQQLRSILIEPVQRLPRYTLFIDNILNLIPPYHIARPMLLGAREVMAEMCTFRTNASDKTKHASRILQSRIINWPDQMPSPCRLISAVDANEPKTLLVESSPGRPVMILQFPSHIIVLRKLQADSISARGLLAEIEHSNSLLGNTANAPIGNKDLECIAMYPLGQTWVTSSHDGDSLHLSRLPATPVSTNASDLLPSQVFRLQGSYCGKAKRFVEETAKAFVDYRYSSAFQDGGRWSLRSLAPQDNSIGLLFSILEASSSRNLQDVGVFGNIRLYVDSQRTQKPLLSENTGAMIVGHLILCNDGPSTIRIESHQGAGSYEQCKPEDSAETFRSRVQQLLRSRLLPDPGYHVTYDAKVLDALPLDTQPRGSKHRGMRPRSPVKLISNMLGSINGSTLAASRFRSRTIPMEDTPLLAPPSGTKWHSNSETFDDSPIKQVVGSSGEQGQHKSSLDLLEDTFHAYITALRSRSGNVVGKLLQTRAQTDELAVNELYNALLQNPERLETAAVASVDVLFSAFEKFLRVAWRERMGPVFPPNVAKEILAKFESAKQTDFLDFFKQSLEEMSPQNRRALVATMRLLYDLLEASSNDGDRGVLIASFAEALIFVGNPHDYIQLLDRVVDEYDSFFEDALPGESSRHTDLSYSSQNRSFNNNSFGSNASSLRRKFGMGGGSFREHGKLNTDSKAASFWRTLSKSGRTQGEASSIMSASKASLVRSKSTDTDVRVLPPSRPISRDRPVTSGSKTSDVPRSRDGTSRPIATESKGIADVKTAKHRSVPYRKRRSSLSDLQKASAWAGSEPISPLRLPQKQEHHKSDSPRGEATEFGSNVPPKPLEKRAVQKQRQRTSKETSGIPRLRSPETKENDPPARVSPVKVSRENIDAVKITSHIPVNRVTPLQHLPTSRTGLSERAWSSSDSNIQHQSPPHPQSNKCLPSPQKVRQRLTKEPKPPSSTNTALQTEMALIGQELSGWQRRENPAKQDVSRLGERLDRLQKQLNDQIAQRPSSSSHEVSNQKARLTAAEKKIKALDELYGEANAENEALYERFNDELGKILSRVRKGEGVEEMRSQLRASQEDMSKLRVENAKLKRQVAVANY